MLKVVIAALKAKASRRLESRGQRLTSRTTSLAAVGVQGVETSTRVSCCDEPRSSPYVPTAPCIVGCEPSLQRC